MCIICADLIKGLLTTGEARKNLRELNLSPSHVVEILETIKDIEDEKLSLSDPEPFDPFWLGGD